VGNNNNNNIFGKRNKRRRWSRPSKPKETRFTFGLVLFYFIFTSLCDGDGPLAAAEMAVDEMCCVWEMPTMKSYRRYVA
jgi:hypothetical protein